MRLKTDLFEALDAVVEERLDTINLEWDPRPGVTVHLRGGAFFEPSPAPAQTGTANRYDNARVALSLGYGLALAAPFPRVSRRRPIPCRSCGMTRRTISAASR